MKGGNKMYNDYEKTDNIEKIQIGWLTIPNQIVFDNKIRPLSKFVLGLILSFQYHSQCYASNEWFASQFDVSVRTIESVIKELRDLDYIETRYDASKKRRLIMPANIEHWIAYRDISKGKYGHMKDGIDEKETDVHYRGYEPSMSI